MLPVTFCAAIGLKITFSEALCPAPRLSGVLIPLVVKFEALTLICEMVALEFPVLVIVTGWELELPTLMPLKFRLKGFAESVAVAAVPVPLSATILGELGALLLTLTLPVKFPAVVGAN
jgi:hypothetical protein